MTIGADQMDSGTLLDIELDSGRSIWCWQYLASYTYAHFQIRSSSDACNQAMLEGAQREAKRVFGDWPIHVLEPVRAPQVVDFPKVRYTAFFTSLPMKQEMHLSSLVLVWFQPLMTVTPDDRSLKAIRATDWERLAVDYET